MKHYILVKLTDEAKARKGLFDEVERLFMRSTELAGVHSVSVCGNIVARPNRYDIMIVITMDREALEAYDSSAMHLEWKEKYGSCVAQKAIFDCE